MGNLPKERLQGNRPFEISGVNLFGPVTVSLGIRGKQTVKMYIAVVVGRRGPVVKLYCDNATNFVGAARILKELLEPVDTNDQSVMAYAAAHRFTIEFIPPRAPHIGGLWEAAVRSAKHLLLKDMGNATLKEDELHTVIVEVEAILNSRPLIVDIGSPNEGEVVTSAHLLVGTTLATLPPATVQPKADGNLTYLQRCQLVSAIKQRFWSDWSRDYLLSLQQREKWTKGVNNLQIGTVVAIHEDNVPPQLWIMGVVVEVDPGHDGKARVAVVKTKSGLYKRSIHRLAPIPIS
ncbi:uncharacterized protein LOC121530370 [Drosophila eugracilis]|uniref:uncharacterized protein LOC121530370 n=1 Tax=Drosophila eugracilis TaxID=29029 RepID=UPI001BD9687D|nr:uncharacterized protein LOC121530370 [Drosophila eugracilis]